MIWCIEDDKNIRDIEIYTLKSTGFEAVGFSNGRDFFKALDTHIPELIILDIMLPDMDGVEVLKKLKQNSKSSDIPVIEAINANNIMVIKINFLPNGFTFDTMLSNSFL